VKYFRYTFSTGRATKIEVFVRGNSQDHANRCARVINGELRPTLDARVLPPDAVAPPVVRPKRPFYPKWMHRPYRRG